GDESHHGLHGPRGRRDRRPIHPRAGAGIGHPAAPVPQGVSGHGVPGCEETESAGPQQRAVPATLRCQFERACSMNLRLPLIALLLIAPDVAFGQCYSGTCYRAPAYVAAPAPVYKPANYTYNTSYVYPPAIVIPVGVPVNYQQPLAKLNY